MRILVTDDDPLCRSIAARMVERLGHHAETVNNGREAVDALSRAVYDLVLMDCEMPEMDGYDATREIRRREQPERHTPIIAVTSNEVEGNGRRCFDAGMDGYLPKPIDMNALGLALERWSGDGPEPALDMAIVESLRTLEMLQEIRALYVAQAEGRLRELRQAAVRGDAEEVARIAHLMKGGAGQVGATALAAVCAQIEAVCVTGDVRGAARMLPILEFEIARTLSAINQLGS